MFVVFYLVLPSFFVLQASKSIYNFGPAALASRPRPSARSKATPPAASAAGGGGGGGGADLLGAILASQSQLSQFGQVKDDVTFGQSEVAVPVAARPLVDDVTFGQSEVAVPVAVRPLTGGHRRFFCWIVGNNESGL